MTIYRLRCIRSFQTLRFLQYWKIFILFYLEICRINSRIFKVFRFFKKWKNRPLESLDLLYTCRGWSSYSDATPGKDSLQRRGDHVTLCLLNCLSIASTSCPNIIVFLLFNTPLALFWRRLHRIYSASVANFTHYCFQYESTSQSWDNWT